MSRLHNFPHTPLAVEQASSGVLIDIQVDDMQTVGLMQGTQCQSGRAACTLFMGALKMTTWPCSGTNV